MLIVQIISPLRIDVPLAADLNQATWATRTDGIARMTNVSDAATYIPIRSQS